MEGRHLERSALYEEDRLVRGHAAVWGSFFDPASKRWGYACCRGIDRGVACPLAADAEAATSSAAPGGAAGSDARRAEGEGEEDDDSKAAEARGREWRASRMLDAPPPEALRPREACASDEDFLAEFVLFWFHAWANGASSPGSTASATASASSVSEARLVQQSREALLPLLQQLERRAVPRDLLANLATFASFAAEGEYAKANDVYITMTIGKALWHSNLDLGEQRAHWGQGCSLRTMQRQVVEKDMKNASLFDTDPVVQRYIHALKRLVTHMQAAKPAVDPSKAGHVPAPAPNPAEVGLPVICGVRDSDGSRRGSLPEYAEPDDPRHAGPSGVRGISFGARADRTGLNVPTNRNSHPFAAP